MAIKKPEAPANKRGFLSKENKSFIARNASQMTAEHIAMLIRRPVEQVQRYIDDQGLARTTLKVGEALNSELEDRPEWAEFRHHYDDEELSYIKYRYVQLMNQFGKDDVLPTEEMQIFSLIQLEVVSNQTMRERKPLVTSQKRLQSEMALIQSRLDEHEPDEAPYKKLASQVDALQGKLGAISDTLKGVAARQQSLQMQQQKLMENLKATRDQRVKTFEGSKTSFLGFLKALRDSEFREEHGREMEMMRIAMVKERERMALPHTYIDRTVDQPLLTPDTVTDYDQPALDGGAGGRDGDGDGLEGESNAG